MDNWILIRDLIFYVSGVAMIVQFNKLGTDWWIGIVFLGYAFVYLFIQFINTELKELILKDVLQYNIYEDYNSLNYQKFKKRRNSISDLMPLIGSLSDSQAYQKKLKVAQTVVILNL